jgi:putative phage regulatory protein
MTLNIIERNVNGGITLVVDSRDVAKAIDKEHFHLVRDIDTYIYHMENPPEELNPKMDSTQNPLEFFIPHEYTAKNKKKNRCFLLTELGCQFVAIKNTGANGTIYAAAFLKEFNRMRDILQQRDSAQWQQIRQQGKAQRRDFTDTIKQLIEYAITNGMKENEANKFYWKFTNIINNCFGIKKNKGIPTRDLLDRKTLRNLDIFEEQAERFIQEGIENNAPYFTFLPVVESRLFSLLGTLGYILPKQAITPQFKEYLKEKQLQLKQAT